MAQRRAPSRANHPPYQGPSLRHPLRADGRGRELARPALHSPEFRTLGPRFRSKVEAAICTADGTARMENRNQVIFMPLMRANAEIREPRIRSTNSFAS